MAGQYRKCTEDALFSQFQMHAAVTPSFLATSLWRRPRSYRRLLIWSPSVFSCVGCPDARGLGPLSWEWQKGNAGVWLT